LLFSKLVEGVVPRENSCTLYKQASYLTELISSRLFVTRRNYSVQNDAVLSRSSRYFVKPKLLWCAGL